MATLRRRDFLKAAGATGLMTAATGTSLAQTEKPVRIGIVGARAAGADRSPAALWPQAGGSPRSEQGVSQI